MNRRAFLLGGAAALARWPPLLGAAAPEARDFGSLFDGKTLAGWHRPVLPEGDRYGGGRWSVRDGAICGEQFPAGDRRGSLLLTDRRYGDFEFEADVHPDWGCDTGLYLRSTARGDAIQVMIDYLEGGSVGYLFGQGTGGFFSCPVELRAKAAGAGIEPVDVYDAVKQDGLIYAADAALWRAAWRPAAWNTLRIRCGGAHPRITTWINGEKICEMDGAAFHPRRLKDVKAGNWGAPSAYDPEAIRAQLGTAGHIALQVHPGERWAKDGLVRFRNLRIREL